MIDSHPNYLEQAAALIKFFKYDHLPSNLQLISAPFASLASQVINMRDQVNGEIVMALRKLLEAKDCAVRAAL